MVLLFHSPRLEELRVLQQCQLDMLLPLGLQRKLLTCLVTLGLVTQLTQTTLQFLTRNSTRLRRGLTSAHSILTRKFLWDGVRSLLNGMTGGGCLISATSKSTD